MSQKLNEPALDHIIIIGSGATRNSYSPILKAFETVPPIILPNGIFRGIYEDKRLAAHALGNASFSYRAIRSLLTRHLSENNPDPLDHQKLEVLSGCMTHFVTMRKAVADEYLKAQNEQTIGSLIDFKIYPFSDINWSRTGVITTNWDELLWSMEVIPNLIQLHGRASCPDSLVLPTELILDEETFAVGTNSSSQKRVDEMVKLFGEEKTREIVVNSMRTNSWSELVKAHRTAISWLEGAKRVTFFGLNLNVYDAELNSVLNARDPKISAALEEITVINPDSRTVFLSAAIMMFDPKRIRHINPLPLRDRVSNYLKRFCP